MITAIVSLYNPEENVRRNVLEISRQTDRVILCDNSTKNHSEMFKGIENMHYICFHKNLGISGAFNRILRDASYKWVSDDFIIFFDQDSNIEIAHIEKMIDVFFRLRGRGHDIGCIGPIFFNRSRDRVEMPHLKVDIDDNTMLVKNIITSSLLTTYDALKRIDFFNEDIFLDFVDWDLCWRLQEIGLSVFMTKEVILDHAVGLKDKRVAGIMFRVGVPVREYYQTRDALVLMKKKYTPAKMKIRLWANVYIRPFIHFIILTDKINRIRYIVKGIKDYRNNIYGEYKIY